MNQSPKPNPTAKEIFLEAMELPADQRAAFLDRACADDALRGEVESLLRCDSRAGQFLDGPTLQRSELASSIAHQSESERQIGPYKLLQIIGEGGFGTVYMAEQETPVRRRVALKVIKLGMDTKQVVARFEAERQALAMMEHPNIARVFDAGATTAGRPYFVMELVRGIPITEYCDQGSLTITSRLELFAQVCQAVQHAHTKGLIHRDIKPSNILVSTMDDRPLVKVIDFGVAKATQSRLTEKTLFTEFRQFIGTPEYMSPEQAGGGLDVDTRADVYSLGVLLYELLTGTPPFDARELRSKAYAEIERVIREVDPPKPSTRLSTLGDSLAAVAAHRGHIEPRKLGDLVRGELDWIAMKALEKDRSRRYETAASLAADVRRFLDNEPVSAAPRTATYRISKFAQRHKGAVIASAAMLALLVAGTIGTTIGFIGEAKQRAAAEAQALEAKQQSAITEAVNQFQADMLSSADPSRLLGDKVTVVEVIDAAVRELDAGKLKEQPLVEAGVRRMIGNTLKNLGRYDAAEPNLRKSVQLLRMQLGADDVMLGTALNDLGTLLDAAGKIQEAEANFREAIAIYDRALPQSNLESLGTRNNLALLMRAQGRFAEAEPIFRQVLATRRATLPASDALIGTSTNNLALLLGDQGRFDEAEPLFRETLEIFRTAYPAGHPEIAQAVNNLGSMHLFQGRIAESEPFFREALAIRRNTLPEGHPVTGQTIGNLASLLLQQGKSEEAEALFRETLQIQQEATKGAHPDTALALSNLAAVLHERGKLQEAEQYFHKGLAMRRQVLPPDHPDIASTLNNYASLLVDCGKLADAEPLYREALDIQRKSLPAEHPDIAWTMNMLARLLHKQGKAAEAETYFRDALAMRRRVMPAGHPQIAINLSNYAAFLLSENRALEAEPLYREAAQICQASYGPDHGRTAMVQMGFGKTLMSIDRRGEAETLLVGAEAALRAARGAPPESHQQCVEALVVLYDGWEQADPGKGYADKSRQWQSRLQSAAEAQPAAATLPVIR